MKVIQPLLYTYIFLYLAPLYKTASNTTAPSGKAFYSCDPKKCHKSACCQENKADCATSKSASDCKYLDAEKWTCLNNDYCPTDYKCDTKTLTCSYTRSSISIWLALIYCLICYGIPYLICMFIMGKIKKKRKAAAIVVPQQQEQYAYVADQQRVQQEEQPFQGRIEDHQANQMAQQGDIQEQALIHE